MTGSTSSGSSSALPTNTGTWPRGLCTDLYSSSASNTDSHQQSHAPTAKHSVTRVRVEPATPAATWRPSHAIAATLKPIRKDRVETRPPPAAAGRPTRTCSLRTFRSGMSPGAAAAVVLLALPNVLRHRRGPAVRKLKWRGERGVAVCLPFIVGVSLSLSV